MDKLEKRIEKFEIRDNKVDIYIKRPRFTNYRVISEYFSEKYFDDYKTFLGCRPDCSNQSIILTFMLRNVEELKLYMKYNGYENEIKIKDKINKILKEFEHAKAEPDNSVRFYKEIKKVIESEGKSK